MRLIEIPSLTASIKAVDPTGKEVVIDLHFLKKFLVDILEGSQIFASRSDARIANKMLDLIDDCARKNGRSLKIEDDWHSKLKAAIADGAPSIWVPKVTQIFERFGYYAAIENAKEIKNA